MRLAILSLLAILAINTPALAQPENANPTIIINADGSYTVIGEMPTVPVRQDPMPTPSPRALAPVPVAEVPHAADLVVSQALPPTPQRKPAYVPVMATKKKQEKTVSSPAALPPTPYAPPAAEEYRQDDGFISSDEARRIALAVAPPSRRVDVYPADFNGQKVFQVVFKTDSGDQAILVDRQTGDIVEEKPKSKKNQKRK